MKKWLIPVIIIVALIFVVGAWFASVNNRLAPMEETVEAQWANVESAYQRRADLIPNIVNTAKGYAEFEQETLTQVIEARSRATSVNIDPTNITPEQLEQFQAAQGNLSSALSRLLAVFERYPDLKANENFKELINELERTENRINVERNRFNDTARAFNSEIRQFPTSFAAGILDFDRKAYYEAEAGSEQAPVVEF
ncbi:MAG: LemA family protein [Flavobacteriaceae bacterium]|nr:LemA family protein [Flavobacteriaceae bacterium]